MERSFSNKHQDTPETPNLENQPDVAEGPSGALAHKFFNSGLRRPTNLTTRDISTIQRTLGNQAVLRLLGKRKKAAFSGQVQRLLTVSTISGSPFNNLDPATIKPLVANFNLKKAEAEQLKLWANTPTADDPQAFTKWEEAISFARLKTLKVQALNKLNTHIKVRDGGGANEIKGCHDEGNFKAEILNIGAAIKNEKVIADGVKDIEYTMPGKTDVLVKTVHDSAKWTDDVLVDGVVDVVKKAFDTRKEQEKWLDTLKGIPIMVYLNNFDEILNYHFVEVKATPGSIPTPQKYTELLAAMDTPNFANELPKRNITKSKDELKNLVIGLSTNPKIKSFDQWVEQTWPVKDSPGQVLDHINEIREAEKRMNLPAAPTVDVSEGIIKGDEGLPVTNQTADLEYESTQVEIKTVGKPITQAGDINAQLAAAIAKFANVPTSATQSYHAVVYASYDPTLLASKTLVKNANIEKKQILLPSGKLKVSTSLKGAPFNDEESEFFGSVAKSLNTDSTIVGRDKINQVTIRMENGDPVVLEKAGTTWTVKR